MDNTQILIDALENIASHSTDYEIVHDTAIKALVDYRNAEYKKTLCNDCGGELIRLQICGKCKEIGFQGV